MSERGLNDESEVICNCSGTTLGQVMRLLNDGVDDLERISRITGAMSGCGGCEFDMQALLQQYRTVVTEE
jgi:bacterioferritin-associated ferredoxin